MALDTYGGLKSAVVDWSFNGGGLTTAIVESDLFPQMQAMMYRGHGTDIQPLRISAMVDSATLTPTAGAVTISTGVSTTWLEFIELTPNISGGVSLNYVPPWDFRKEADAIADTVGPQNIYTIEGDTLYTAPSATTGLKAKWYEKFTALSGDSDTDWIILNAPHVYLDGCLMLGCAYTQDDREAMFRQKFAAGIRALNLNDRQSRSSGSVKVARPRSVV